MISADRSRPAKRRNLAFCEPRNRVACLQLRGRYQHVSDKHVIPPRCESSKGRSQSRYFFFFFFFASFCSKFFQEAFNHAGPFPRMSVSILITRGLGGWTGGEAYCFCIVSTISSVWTCVCSQISARVSGDSVLSCLLTSTTDTARRMTDPVSCVAVESPRPGGGGLEKTNGVPKSAVTNAFQRLADRLANQYNSNGCFCLLYK